MKLTLAKIVAVNGKNTLGPQFERSYFPEIDMYLFFSEVEFDTETGSYSGTRLMHDKIIALERLPELDDQDVNYITIDIKSTDRTHTYMRMNRRCYQLTNKQRFFIADLFEADYC